jgi:hypothetical protein
MAFPNYFGEGSSEKSVDSKFILSRNIEDIRLAGG